MGHCEPGSRPLARLDRIAELPGAFVILASDEAGVHKAEARGVSQSRWIFLDARIGLMLSEARRLVMRGV